MPALPVLRLVPPASPDPAPPASKLNLDDCLVAEMADFNHLPEEDWPEPEEVLVVCGTCHQEWPCQTRRALRARAQEEWP